MNDQNEPAHQSCANKVIFYALARRSIAFELDLLASNLSKLRSTNEIKLAQLHASETNIGPTYPRSPRANQLKDFLLVCSRTIQTCNQVSEDFRKGHSAPTENLGR